MVPSGFELVLKHQNNMMGDEEVVKGLEDYDELGMMRCINLNGERLENGDSYSFNDRTSSARYKRTFEPNDFRLADPE